MSKQLSATEAGSDRIKCAFLVGSVAFFLLAGTARAQLDTQHWIPPQYAAAGFATQQSLFLTTPEVTPVNVTVTDGAGTPVFAGTVSNAAPQQVNLGLLNVLTSTAELNQASSEGLVIVADEPIYANIRHTTSAQGASLTAKGLKGLGTRFRAGVLREDVLPPYHYRGVFIAVMATEDATTVDFSQIKSGVVFFGTAASGAPLTTDPITVSLNQHESYVIGIQASVYGGTAQLDDVTGTLVTSDKPIVVNSGSWLGGPGNLAGQDIGVDQLVDEQLAGSEYVIIKGNAPNGSALESPTVVATVAGTDVFVNGSAVPVNGSPLGPGDYIYLDGLFTAGENMLVQATQPIFLFQTIGGSSSFATPGLNFIPPLGVGSANFVDNIANVGFLGAPTLGVIAKTGAPVLVNGVPVAAAPQAVAGTAAFVTYKVTGLSGDVAVSSTDTIAVALYNVSGAVGAAGYFSGFPAAIFGGEPNVPDGEQVGSMTTGILRQAIPTPAPGTTCTASVWSGKRSDGAGTWGMWAMQITNGTYVWNILPTERLAFQTDEWEFFERADFTIPAWLGTTLYFQLNGYFGWESFDDVSLDCGAGNELENPSFELPEIPDGEWSPAFGNPPPEDWIRINGSGHFNPNTTQFLDFFL